MAGRGLESELAVMLHPQLELYGIHRVEPPPDALWLQFTAELNAEVVALAKKEDIRASEKSHMRDGAKYLYDQASHTWYDDHDDRTLAISRTLGIAAAHRVLRIPVEAKGEKLPEITIPRAGDFTAHMRVRPDKLNRWFDVVTTGNDELRNLVNGFRTDQAKFGAKMLIGLFGDFINPSFRFDVPGHVPAEVPKIQPAQLFPPILPQIQPRGQAGKR